LGCAASPKPASRILRPEILREDHILPAIVAECSSAEANAVFIDMEHALDLVYAAAVV
jgi:hypothetical protein